MIAAEALVPKVYESLLYWPVYAIYIVARFLLYACFDCFLPCVEAASAAI